MKNEKAQIWVETVIYTLIILVIIGVLLAVLTPAIEDKKDQVLLEKSADMLNEINNVIQDLRFYGAGNSVPVEIQMKKGQLIIDGRDDSITFTTRSNYAYSEINETILQGNLKVLTISRGKDYEVTFKIEYFGIVNISWDKQNIEKTINYAPNVQKIWITNYGRTDENLINIDLNS